MHTFNVSFNMLIQLSLKSKPLHDKIGRKRTDYIHTTLMVVCSQDALRSMCVYQYFDVDVVSYGCTANTAFVTNS